MFELRRDRPQARITSYDDYFLLFGNYDLKIQAEKSKVESNFGMGTSYFESGNHHSPEVLFGEDARQQVLACYEIYQLVFDH